jgi:hypothetical protein
MSSARVDTADHAAPARQKLTVATTSEAVAKATALELI